MRSRPIWLAALICTIVTVSGVLADPNKQNPNPPPKPQPKQAPQPKPNPPAVDKNKPPMKADAAVRRAEAIREMRPREVPPWMVGRPVDVPGLMRPELGGWNGAGWFMPRAMPPIVGGIGNVGAFAPPFAPPPMMPPNGAAPVSPGETTAGTPNGIDVVLRVADDAQVLALQAGTRNFYGPATFATLQAPQQVSVLVKTTPPSKDPLLQPRVATWRLVGQVMSAEGDVGARILTVRVPMNAQNPVDNGANSVVTGITIHTPVMPVALK